MIYKIIIFLIEENFTVSFLSKKVHFFRYKNIFKMNMKGWKF